MKKSEENQFFSSACQALIDEDQELRELFTRNDPLYSQQHNGICCLYETTMVYRIFKQLMKDRFPYSLSWEHPYPGNPGSKADLAILNPDKNIKSLVEFKIWTSEKGDEVRGDVEKYLRCSFTGSKYLFIVEYAGPESDIIDNRNFLQVNNPEMDFLRMESFTTTFYDHQKTKQHVYNPINLYFFKMK